MHFITRLLMAVPKNLTVPVLAVLAGWYGGTKYGAPDFVMNSIDDILSRSASAVGSFIGGDEAPASENGADNGEAGDEA